MKCLNCGSENPEAKRFCRECGAKLLLICSRCGVDVLPEDRFCGACGQKLYVAAVSEKVIPSHEGERKHATVLFSDLSGYTAMTERLDPEDVKAMMSRIFGEIEQVVTKYEGLVERFFGDEAMVLFGVPKAHEEDPVRAVRAAIEIQDTVERISPEYEVRVGQPLAMHMGISTGLVITGDEYIGKGRHGLTGDTVNLAARLTKLAQPGEILVGPDTYSQAEGYFTFESIKPTEVKGKEEPVRIYRVLSPKKEPTKVHRIHGVRAELIGRNQEMSRLAEAVQRLREGESSIVSICGDAGTGKSRLVEEFKATLNLEQMQWREGHAYAFAQNIPFFPMIDMMNRTWEIEEGDPPQTVKEKVKSNIENLLGKGKDVVPYVGSLYALNYPEIEGVDPEFWRNQLYKAIQQILSAIAQRAPTVICLEDLHWADPSSLDLLRFILSEFTHPALFLFVYRPHFNLFFADQTSTPDQSLQEIRIGDLSPSEAQDMTLSLLKTKTIPAELQSFVQERVEGNPFYLEEVINSLIETETLVRDNGNWKLTRSIRESGISPTIHGVISGRLDRLEKETKRILQEASVIGRAFLYEILKGVTDLKEHIDHSLSGLERLDLIRIKTLQPELEYIFKHALTQKVVYEGLLKKQRREIHERIGLVMEKMFNDRLPEFCESLAFHFKQGLSTLKAVDFLMKSGEKNLKRYALKESDQYFQDAFDILTSKLNRSKEEDRLLIDLLIHWAEVFHYRGHFKKLSELLGAHVNLAESLDDKSRLGRLYVWVGVAALCRGRCRDSYEHLRNGLKLGEETQNQHVIGYACGWLGWSCAHLGLLDEGIGFGERAQEMAKHIPSDQFLHFQSLAGLAYLYWQRGEKKKALEKSKALLAYGERNLNIRSLFWGTGVIGLCHLLNGDFPSAIEYGKKALGISQDPWLSQIARYGLGAIYAASGEFQEAENVSRKVADYSEKFGAELIETPANMYIGVALIAKGRMELGLRMIEQARGLLLENDRRCEYAMSEYILGKVYLQIVERAVPMSLSRIVNNIGFLVKNVPFARKKAESHFNKAIEVAQEIGAKGTLGQAYLDLGLLHKVKNNEEKAKECLSKAIGIFEQSEAKGFLKQAREALASLG